MAKPSGQVPWRFETTRWSLVLQAGGAEARQAVTQLCEAYWQPVQAFFRTQGARESEDEASDLTQGFFADLYERGDFANLDRSRGKFRSWLCVCAKNYLRRVRNYEGALKRSGEYEQPSSQEAAEGQEPRRLNQQLRLDQPGVLELVAPELLEGGDPERLFNRRWALTVISRAMDRLRQHYADCDKSELFQSLEARWCDEPALSDADLAALLGSTQDGIRQARYQLKAPVRERFARFVRAEIAETVSAREHIDEELRDLLRALA